MFLAVGASDEWEIFYVLEVVTDASVLEGEDGVQSVKMVDIDC